MKCFVTINIENKIFHSLCNSGDTITVGSGKKDMFFLETLLKSDIQIRVGYDGYYEVSVKSKNVIKEEFPLGSDFSTSAPIIYIVVEEYQGFSDQTLQLPYQCYYRIGRSSDNDICIKSDRVSRKHLIISSENGIIRVMDQGSKNGVYLNGTEIKKGQLHSGDTLSLMNTRIYLKNRELQFENVGKELVIHTDKEEKKSEKNEKSIESIDSKKRRTAPRYSRSPRIREALPQDAILLDSPPSRAERVKRSFGGMFGSLLGTGAMAAAGLAAGMASPALAAARLASLISPLSHTGSYFVGSKKGTKEYERREKERQEKYGQYIENQKRAIEAVAESQRRIICHENPTPRECMKIASSLGTALWERRPSDNDFLTVRIGEGYEELCVPVKSQDRDQDFVLERDELKELQKQIIEETRIVDNVPARVNLAEYHSIGIVGKRSSMFELVKNMLVELTTLHFYKDVRVVGLFAEKERNIWKELRWMPHIWDETEQMRFLAFTAEDRKKLCDYLYEGLHSRFALAGKDAERINDCRPYYVFLIGEPDCIAEMPIRDDLLNNLKGTGVTGIFLYGRQEKLPHNCEYIISVDGIVDGKEYGCPCAFPCKDANAKTLFTMDEPVSDPDFSDLARQLFAIEPEEDSIREGLPDNISFLEGFHIIKADQLDIESNWKRNRYSQRMPVPIGVNDRGKVFQLDLLGHGPHGLVVGTTGSGKSELMQTWILSTAVHYHPQDVNFVIIDFKGESFAGQVKELPHVVGTITNIKTSGGGKTDINRSISRAIESLNHEIHRREELFAEVKAEKFSEYQKAYLAGVTNIWIPRLVIVADEFAQFKKSQPELMKKLIDVAVVGRALGIHLVLATQEPGGIVDDQISSNTNFRICLKVNSAATSREVIGRSDAAKLSKPGRAYIRVGNDEVFELIQSYYSGADYQPNQGHMQSPEEQCFLVELSGQRRSFAEKQKKEEFFESEIEILIDQIRQTTQRLGIEQLPSPWYEDLPVEIKPHELGGMAFDGENWNASDNEWLRIPVGRYDVPRQQEQGTLFVNPAENGQYGVYGAPASGKTWFLKTLAAGACRNYSPADVSLYLLDFGGWSLAPLRDYPHVGDLILDFEEEKLLKFISMIREESERRRKLFFKYAVSNLTAYRKTVAEDLPAILILLDNLPAMTGMYPDTENFLIQLTEKGASYGIYLCYTANSYTQVKTRISANVKAVIAFELVDKGDYALTVGRLGDAGIPNIPGRGYVKGSPPVEFQAAVFTEGIDEIRRNAALKQEGVLMRSRWKGKLPPAVPVMPEHVEAEDFVKSIRHYTQPMFGVSYQTTMPAGLDLGMEYCAVIAGGIGSGKSRLLETEAKMIKQKVPNCQLFVFDSDRCSLQGIREIADRYAIASDEIESSGLIDELVQILNVRLGEFRKAQEKEGTQFDERSFAQAQRPICILIDDIHSSYTLAEQNAWNRMEKISRHAKNLGIIILGAGRISDLSRDAVSEPVTRNLLSGQKGIGLSDNAAVYSTIFAFNMAYDEKSKSFGKGNAMLFENGECSKIKLVEAK